MVRIVESADVSPSAVIGEGSSVWHLAQVREDAVLGENCVIGRGAYVGTGVHLGDNCKVQNYALVYEPAQLGHGVFIGPAAVLTNDHNPRAINPDGSIKDASDWEPVGVTIEEGAAIGARAVCVAPVTIGKWATVAAGAPGDAAAVNGSKLAVGAKVALRIDSLREKGEAAAVVTRERLLREIGRLAFCDPRKLTNEDGTFKPLHELDDDTAAAISSIEVDEYGKVKYKMLDKGPAQEKLAKYLGLYEKDNRQRTDPMAELAKALLGSVVGPGGLNLPEPAPE